MPSADHRYSVKARRFGTVHIVRYWTVCLDGLELDHYPTRELAQAYADYMNGRA